MSYDGLVAAARSGQETPAWSKFKNGTWLQPALGGDFTGMDSPAAGIDGIPGHHIVHSGAAYSSATGKYYLTTYTNALQYRPFPGWPQGNGVFLFESSDLVTWAYVRTVFWSGNPTDPTSGAVVPGFEYVSIASTDEGAWSVGQVGATFHVYSVFDQGSGTEKNKLYRQTVTVP